MDELRTIADEFQGDSTDEEMHDIVTAMQLKNPLSAGENWLARLDTALNEFWADTPTEERAKILKAITTKSTPLEKGV